MIARIIENLSRQVKAADLLRMLLEEEFAHLKGLSPQQVAGVEFSIQELLRQLAAERMSIRTAYRTLSPEAKRLTDVLPHFPKEERETALALFKTLDRLEQKCAKQAENNYKMALGLYDQNRSYLDFIQKKITPKKNVYSANGRFGAAASNPAFLRGRY